MYIKYPELSELIETKFNVKISPNTLGNFFRTIKKKEKEAEESHTYEYDKIVSHEFKKNAKGLNTNRILFKIKWKGYDELGTVKPNEIVNKNDIISYLTNQLYEHEKYKRPMTP